MSNDHLATSERFKIESYLKLGFSMRKITNLLVRQPPTISLEMKWNLSYNAIDALEFIDAKSI